MVTEHCAHGHALRKIDILDEVLSVATKHYYCSSAYCRNDMLFCKICKINGMPHRSISYLLTLRSITDHILIIHGGMEGIHVDVQYFMFPTHFIYLRSEELFNKIRGHETLDDIRLFMQLCEYICIVCKYSYDSIPSKEVVISHMKKCLKKLKSHNAN